MPRQATDTASALAFESFSGCRLAILQALEGRRLRFSVLAQNLDISHGELSRNLNRLVGADLLDKDPSGTFGLTPLAEVMLDFVPSFATLARHREFFRTHEVGAIPPDLRLRLGALENTRVATSAAEVIRVTQRLQEEVEEFVWATCIRGTILDVLEVTEKQAAFFKRILDQRIESRSVVDSLDLVELDETHAAVLASGVGVRLAKRIPFAMILTEKGGGLALPDRSGTLDLTCGIYGETPEYITWCRDLFLTVWNEAEPVAPPIALSTSATKGELAKPRARGI